MYQYSTIRKGIDTLSIVSILFCTTILDSLAGFLTLGYKFARAAVGAEVSAGAGACSDRTSSGTEASSGGGVCGNGICGGCRNWTLLNSPLFRVLVHK